MDDELKENRRRSAEKIARGEYDVFISYNHKDREQVIEIGELLKNNGIAPWLDEWDLQPGLPWQPELDQKIEAIKSAAIFIGQAGMGSYHQREMYAFEREFSKRGLSVIPVLLPNIAHETKIPIFLEGMTWVDFRKKDPDPLERLLWGITGKKYRKIYRPGILIASLGELPVVVSSMYDLLKEREKLDIDRVTILAPQDSEVRDAYALVKDTLERKVQGLTPDYEGLEFEDADSWTNTSIFLQRLYKLLEHYQQQGESVYLSLAGGRKSMAALMAWVVPFFPCVKGLYHVIDKEGEVFRSANDIKGKSKVKQHQLMEPDLDKLILVEIPFERGEVISPNLIKHLRSSSSRDHEKAEALIMGQTIFQQGDILQLRMTDLALAQFYKLCRENKIEAQELHNGLLEMQQSAILSNYDVESNTIKYKAPNMGRVYLHYFTGLQGAIRPVFYTPSDSPATSIKQVVICALEAANANSEYRTLEEIKASPDFSISLSTHMLPSVPSPADSILIVPLGTSPMIATQLYTLLTKREERIVHKVILIYPGGSVGVDNGAKMVKKALDAEQRREASGQGTEAIEDFCILAPVEGLDDITSEDDCRKYQESLEKAIENVQKKYPNYKIDLALSGGRKGMTAMTMFAAQKHHIPYVYHTLVTDEDTDELIDEETSFAVLNDADSDEERQNRLFLRKYESEGPNPYANFTLFRVPVFSSEDW